MEDDPGAIEQIGIEDLASADRLAEIWASGRHLYWSMDWSADLYLALVRAGFITTACDLGRNIRLLIPEIQKAYAVLDWENLHVSRSLRRWMRSEGCRDQGYELVVGYDLPEVIQGVRRCHGEASWLIEPYGKLLEELQTSGGPDFEVMAIGLVDRERQLIAGEIGYRYGSSYTSLTGFSDCSRRNTGKLQLFKLAEYLRDAGFAFWNLGHPHMPYKTELGARIVGRAEFLKRWWTAGESPRQGRNLRERRNGA